jgi:hypothetical protein
MKEAGMTQTRRSWTAVENDQIRTLAGKVSLEEMARLLNRTEPATRVQACKLGIAAMGTAARRAVDKVPHGPEADSVEQIIAPAAIERALSIYQQLQERDLSIVLQARKILTQHIYGMVDQGECDAQRLTVGGLVHLRAVERDHAIKSAQCAASSVTPRRPIRTR